MSSFTTDRNGRKMVTVTNTADGSQITIYQQGGHISSWKSADGEEHLYNSPKTIYADGKAIRGGVPLIFPQFSDLGPLPVSHGFLRVSNFELKGITAKNGTQEVQLVYQLRPGMQKDLPDANVDVVLTVNFNATHLHMDISVTNNHDSKDFEFGFAFHTYFGAVTEKVVVGGLNDTPYLDDLQDRKRCPPEPVKNITEEIDRIYVNQKTKPVTLSFPTGGRQKTLTISTDNFKDVVLWNPWIEKTKATKDLPEDAYLHFVCVEHGIILEKEVLKPKGGSWHGAQIVNVCFDSADTSLFFVVVVDCLINMGEMHHFICSSGTLCEKNYSRFHYTTFSFYLSRFICYRSVASYEALLLYQNETTIITIFTVDSCICNKAFRVSEQLSLTYRGVYVNFILLLCLMLICMEEGGAPKAREGLVAMARVFWKEIRRPAAEGYCVWLLHFEVGPALLHRALPAGAVAIRGPGPPHRLRRRRCMAQEAMPIVEGGCRLNEHFLHLGGVGGVSLEDPAVALARVLPSPSVVRADPLAGAESNGCSGVFAGPPLLLPAPPSGEPLFKDGWWALHLRSAMAADDPMRSNQLPRPTSPTSIHPLGLAGMARRAGPPHS
eukprot:gene3979-2838_t